MALPSTNPALKGLSKAAMTPGMLGTGGVSKDDPYGMALHQRSQAHDADFLRQQGERDQAAITAGTDPYAVQNMMAHQANDTRMSTVDPTGMRDWLYAFNEATGGKGKLGASLKGLKKAVGS